MSTTKLEQYEYWAASLPPTAASTERSNIANESKMKPYGKGIHKSKLPGKRKVSTKGSARQKARRDITRLSTENGYQQELDDDYEWTKEIEESLYCYDYKDECDCFE